MNNQNTTKDFINIKPIFKKGLHYWYIFAISAFVFAAIAVVYVKLTKPTFTVTANILVKENDNSTAGGLQAALMKSMPFGDMLGGNTSMQDEIEVVKSFSIFKKTVQNLKLNMDYTTKKGLMTVQLYTNTPITIQPIIDIADTLSKGITFKVDVEPNGSGKIKAYTGFFKKSLGETTFGALPTTLHTAYGNFIVNTTDKFKPGKSYSIKATYEDYETAAERLQEEVLVDFVSKKANIINLSMNEQNVKKAKDILNDIIKVYNTNGVEQRDSQAINTIKFLDERIDTIANELYSIERSMVSFKEGNNLTDLEAEAKAIFENGGDVKKQQVQIESQYAVINMIEDFLHRPQNKYALVPLNVGLTDRNVMEGLQQYNSALLGRLKLLRNTKPDNPAVKVIEEQIDVMRNNMLTTVKSLKQGISLTRKDLQSQTSEFNSRLKKMPAQERGYVDLKRQLMLKQEIFLYLLQKKEENALTLSIKTPKTQIVDSAYCITKPLKPRPLHSLLFALGISFIASLLVIRFKENKNKKVQE